MLGHPPIIVLLVVAHGDDLGSAAHRELVLLGAPSDTGGGSVDPQQHQGVLPLTIRTLDPDIGVPVAAAGHDPVGLGRPVNPRHPEVVLVQHRGLGPGSLGRRVEADILAVVRQGQLRPGARPGVTRDRSSSETVNCGHPGIRGLWSVYTDNICNDKEDQ